jgi:hypothetical protein
MRKFCDFVAAIAGQAVAFVCSACIATFGRPVDKFHGFVAAVAGCVVCVVFVFGP